jgi:acyltransferase
VTFRLLPKPKFERSAPLDASGVSPSAGDSQLLTESTAGFTPRPTVPLGPRRLEFVDTARAVGLVLVVLGHAWPDDSTAVRLIYGFHMPLFFFLAGAVLKEEHIAATPREFALRQFRTLVVPYLFFAAVSVAFLLFRRASGLGGDSVSGVSPSDVLRIVATGSGREIRLLNSTLWFFTALLTVSCYYYGLRRMAGPRLLFFAALTAAWALLRFRSPVAAVLPWNLDVAIVCLPFYALGNLFVRDFAPRRIPHSIETLLAAVAFVSGLAFTLANTAKVDLRDRLTGVPELFLAASLLGVLGAAVLVRHVPRSALAERLAAAGIVIFPTHIFVLIVLLAIDRKLFGDEVFSSARMLRGALYAVVAIAVAIPIYRLLMKRIPVALGGRRRTPRSAPASAPT